MTRVLVCGGRNYRKGNHVYRVLEELDDERGPLTIIEGGASGADAFAREWAYYTVTAKHVRFDAEWVKYGRKAGPLRNARMIVEGKPDVVLAFPGGRGTADMVRQAKTASIEVIEVQS